MCADDDSKYDPILENKDSKDGFDITSYLTDPSEPTNSKLETLVSSNSSSTINLKKCRLGGKKIDMEAQKYVIDDSEDDHIDVETVSENGSLPVLEAGDLNSLLEQFEASEEIHSKLNSETKIKTENDDMIEIKYEPLPLQEMSIKREVEDVIEGI